MLFAEQWTASAKQYLPREGPPIISIAHDWNVDSVRIRPETVARSKCSINDHK